MKKFILMLATCGVVGVCQANGIFIKGKVQAIPSGGEWYLVSCPPSPDIQCHVGVSMGSDGNIFVRVSNPTTGEAYIRNLSVLESEIILENPENIVIPDMEIDN